MGQIFLFDNTTKLVSLNGAMKITDPLVLRYANIILEQINPTPKYSDRWSYGRNEERRLGLIDFACKHDFFINEIIKLREFLLNSNISITNHRMRTSKSPTDNGVRISTINWKLVGNSSLRRGFAACSAFNNSTSYYDMRPTPLDIEDIFPYFEKILKPISLNTYFPKKRFSYSNPKRDLREDLGLLLKASVLNDDDIETILKDHKSKIIHNYDDLLKNKFTLKQEFLSNRYSHVIEKIKKDLGKDPFIGNTPTKELAVVFTALSKYPSQIITLQKIFNKYNLDIQNMDLQTIENIIDEVKVL